MFDPKVAEKICNLVKLHTDLKIVSNDESIFILYEDSTYLTFTQIWTFLNFILTRYDKLKSIILEDYVKIQSESIDSVDSRKRFTDLLPSVLACELQKNDIFYYRGKCCVVLGKYGENRVTAVQLIAEENGIITFSKGLQNFEVDGEEIVVVLMNLG